MGKLLKITIKSEVKKLYDIEVKDNHNFVANGILVKNSEQYLSRESLCVLSSLDCGRFSTDFEQLEKELAIIAPSINRFLDNVNECELAYSTCATPHQRLAIEYLRRTGAGVTNIAGWLFNKNVSYGSDKSAEIMEKFMERYAYHLYKSSIKLGEERGSFKLFNREKLEKAPFIKRMKKLGLEFTALRNVTLITIPPSGTVSLMFPESVLGYGVEPAFGIYFWKRTRMKTGNEYLYYFNVPSAVRKAFKKAGLEIPMNSDTIQDDWQGSKGKPIADFIEKNKSKVGIEFKSSTEIKYIDKLELMAKINKWVDSSISTTYMLPENSTVEDVYDFIMLSHEKEVKSISAFPDRKMYGIVSTIPFKELAVKLQNDRVAIHPQNFNDAELKELSLSRENVIVHNNAAPRRELSLKADIYSVTVNKEKYIIAVGIQNGYPYEIFGGKMDGLKIKIDSKHLEGKITRVSRGKYSLEIGDVLVDDFSQQFTPIEKNLFRSLSLMLRYGIPIETIVEQYSKANDDIFSLPAAVARVLKKYIREGSKAGGKTCVKCGSTDLIYADGCVSCSICGTSFCS
jgi:ribonucleoside-diphosphate reductase alpha chain